MIVRSVDLETTGFPPGAAVIEIGWTDIVVDGPSVSVRAPRSMLVNPFTANPDLVMTPGAQATHLIDRSDLVGAPPPEVGFRTLMDGADVFLAHNSEFERQFFAPSASWICTLKLARRLWPDAPSHKLQELRFGLPIEIPDREYARAAHRAGPDAYVAAHLFVLMLAGGLTVDEALAKSGGPMPIPTCPIGKHRGKKWSEIPADYLDWMKRSDLGADLKRAAREELARRVAASKLSAARAAAAIERF